MRDRPYVERHVLVSELARVMTAMERRRGRPVSRSGLAASIHVARSSLYAYLNGTTLPPANVLTLLLTELEVDSGDARRLHALRDWAERARQVRHHPRRHLVPHQLPTPAVERFVGRNAEIAAVRELLDVSPRVVVIHGTAGVGKTTLAVHVAHGTGELFPDGQLYADLNGFADDDPTDPTETLMHFLVALGVPDRGVPKSVRARTELYRSILADRRILVLLDNARSMVQVRPLLPEQPGCAVLVTSRHRLDDLATVHSDARHLGINLPSSREGLLLLGSIIATERIDAEPVAAEELVRLCARLPLAIVVAAANLRTRRELSLDKAVEDLRTALAVDGLPKALTEVPDLRRVFAWSYDVLPKPARRLFRRLGLHPGPSIDRHGFVALLGNAAAADQAVELLHAANLVTVESSGRYYLHSLLRAYAVERLADETPAERRSTVDRLLKMYLDTAIRARGLIQPPAVEVEASGPELTGYHGAMAWFNDEIQVLRSLVALAARYGRDEQAWRLAWECAVFLRRTGRHDERAKTQQIALFAAERSGSRRVRATALRLLADALNRTGSGDEAIELLTRSSRLCAEAGDQDGIRQAHLSMVRVLDRRDRLVDAFYHAEQALRLADLNDIAGTADGLTAVAKQHCRAKRYAEALAYGSEAVARYRQTGNREGLADVLSAMGRAELGLGKHTAAIGHLGEALELDLVLGDRYWAARTLVSMADAHDAGGEPLRAAAYRAHALRVAGHGAP